MSKQQIAQKQLKFVQFLELLEQFLGAFETAPSLDTAWGYIQAAALKAQLPHPPKKLGDFLCTVSQHAANVPSQKLLLAVNNHHHASNVIANNNRQKKHELVHWPHSDLVTKTNLTIIQCDCIPDQYKCGMVLVDHGNWDLARDGEKVLFIPADDTWCMVGEHESVAFINSTGGWAAQGTKVLLHTQTKMLKLSGPIASPSVMDILLGQFLVLWHIHQSLFTFVYLESYKSQLGAHWMPLAFTVANRIQYTAHWDSDSRKAHKLSGKQWAVLTISMESKMDLTLISANQ
ncbi:hypothetical protein EDD15DRAFT_2193090 [Pisolithus albus]|nr:hypothetical protein EDD15DRAFT_2193090 [Pisolithus albus]